MVKHTQTIRRQIADELFECVWPFCEIGTKTVNKKLDFYFPIILGLTKVQPAFTCSKLTKETLEKGKKYVQS